jgi:hypothetical protein
MAALEEAHLAAARERARKILAMKEAQKTAAAAAAPASAS